ncbi:molybdate ABC transporter substrate-binding protein [Mycolicibacterium sp. BiH015]|uniref:molybdate ABC transporter substrate-binding protein n=1 Tax=Mycolicibacterium sp. BiH015 TaxID=3018808 RepID=UPI0022E40DDC|nr:molybdate ABC transporter substrate-binding protein [Mycolicibacterium sp. BiH015]MDA2891157.1 molybdate ABC transporter substrate-binding protein [Mycolicibacterium sp. BiH015]
MKRLPRFIAALSLAAVAVGCTPTEQDSSTADRVTVFAAASLKSTFTELGAQFEKDNPGTTVTFNFAGSSDLVAQLSQGAPADVFASADAANMTKAVDAGLIDGEPVDFATNTLTIVTPPGNPKGIASFADLATPGNQVVVCAPRVPCGSAAEKIEKATGVTLAPVSEESAVTDVLGKVISGQADAGLVYVTDAAGAGDEVTVVPFPESSSAVNTYPIAVLRGSADPTHAEKFVELVTGPRGRDVLSAAGFAAP